MATTAGLTGATLADGEGGLSLVQARSAAPIMAAATSLVTDGTVGARIMSN